MKDWDKIGDNEFDDLFRQSADGYQEPLWPDAWSLMEEKLDEKDKKRRVIVFWRWAAAVFVILSAGLIGNFYLNNSKLREGITQNSPKATSKIDKGNAKVVQDFSIAKSNNKTNLEAATNSSAIDVNQKSRNPNLNSKKGPRFNNGLQIDKHLLLTRNKGNKNITKKQIEKDDFAENNFNQKEKLIVDGLIKISESDNSIVKKEDKQISELPIVDLTEDKSKEKIATSQNSNGVLEIDNDTVIVAMEETSLNEIQEISELKPPKVSIFQKLSFNLGFSPDFSKAEDSPIGNSGYNFQLLLNYKISNKLTFKAGAMKSLKLYDANAGYYAWPAKWGVPSSPLTYVSASCNMWDFPVSLSYDVFEKGKNKYYTSIGITNYKMVKEIYNYHYENDADPNLKWKKWQGATGFYGAGVVNFSLGLERKITNKLSIQIEPFVKIPIKSVGFGSVKLFTTGLFMNVKLPTLKK